MQKFNRSELWQQVKSIGNYAPLRWQSKTIDFLSFISNHHESVRQQEEEYKNTHETLVTIHRTGADGQETVADIIDNLTKKLNEIPAGKLIRLSNGKTFITGDMANNRLADRIFQLCEYDQEITADYEIFDQEVQGVHHEQAYRIGDLNCLLQPILDVIQKKIDNSNSKNTQRSYNSMLKNALLLKEQFMIQGATKELIQSLSNATKSTIKIYDVIAETHLKYKPKDVQKSQFKFKFMNTKFNHVDIWEGSNQVVYLHPNPQIGKNQNHITRSVTTFEKDENGEEIQSTKPLSDDEIIAQSQKYGYYPDYKHMDDLVQKLIGNRQTFKVKTFNDYTVEVDTGSERIICNEYADLKNREKAINELFAPFAVSIRRQRYCPIRKEMVKCYEDSLIKMAMNQSGRVALKPRITQKLQHIDMVAGYTQFQSLPEKYNYGFPLLTDQRKVSSLNFALSHNGLYYVRLSRMPKHISCIFKERTDYSLCSAMLKYFKDQGVSIEISGGIYGCSNEQAQGNQHIKLPVDCQIQSYGKKPYYTAVSKWAIGDDQYKQDFYTFDEEMAEVIRSNSSDIIIKKDPNVYTQIIKKDVKDRYTTKAHLYGFILQYQQLNMMLQLEKMDMNKVHLLCGDDIYYEDHKFEMMPIFRKKGKDNYDIIYDMTENEDNTFLVNSQAQLYCEFGQEEAIYSQYQLHLGQGGSGKTYARHMDIGSINQIYMTLTNALVRDQKNSPFNPKCYTKDKFLARVKQHKLVPSNFIIDEIGLTGYGICSFIKNNFPMARVYMLGDKLQITSEHDMWENPFHQQYDLVLDENHFKTDYRAINCKNLQTLKLKIREMATLGVSEQQQYEYVQKFSKDVLKCEFISNYNTNQLITTCTNYAKDQWTNKLQGDKFRITKTFQFNNIQYCTGDIIDKIPEGFDFEKDQKNKTPKLSRQHAFTCHSLQGMTHYDKLLLTEPNKHSIFKGYVYTAISRLTQIQHLITILDIPSFAQGFDEFGEFDDRDYSDSDIDQDDLINIYRD